ncbi:MAG: antitoxin Xre/MbcA/ParS toxin-binding domain-containing protein [Corticimicrobacter sp.]|uniref:type II RES/Xre toxin-antitoxin system antitoxin n=1 Tax=Corticimicrobacter sp. TaxID=2678536 RepID=UPI0032DA2227
MAKTATVPADEPFASVVNALGVHALHIRTPIELHERIVAGFPRATAIRLVSGLNKIRLDESIKVLNLSARTWQRIKADKAELQKPLDPDRSARLWSLADILAKAETVLGTREDAEQWLSHPAIGLDSHRPIELMSTPQGAALVRTLLEQMEQGVYA